MRTAGVWKYFSGDDEQFVTGLEAVYGRSLKVMTGMGPATHVAPMCKLIPWQRANIECPQFFPLRSPVWVTTQRSTPSPPQPELEWWSCRLERARWPASGQLQRAGTVQQRRAALRDRRAAGRRRPCRARRSPIGAPPAAATCAEASSAPCLGERAWQCPPQAPQHSACHQAPPPLCPAPDRACPPPAPNPPLP